MTYGLIGVIAIAVIVWFIFNYQRSKKIQENGIEADAVVSRIKEIEGEDADGHREVNYEYFVRYQNEEGQTVEARLGNPPRFAMVGTELKVKYLPEKPKYVQLAK